MIELGPPDPLRSVAVQHLLPRALAAAEAGGMTRLADVTRLDRLGLPVWQAIRPMSRALSVHQGKGRSHGDAQLGALLEAVESHCAEIFETDGPICRFRDLPENQRAPTLADFAADRDIPVPGEEVHCWVEAENLLTGRAFALPFDLVSLDLTRAVPSPFDRASNGVATGASRDEALAVALQELIERDAVTEWLAGGWLARTATTIQADSVPFGWFHLWADRLSAAGIVSRFCHVPSVTGSPVFVCELNDLAKDGGAYRTIQGRGCHALPELALFKALAEALQARVTYIAGAREDLTGDEYAPPAGGEMRLAFGLPLPSGMSGLHWSSIAPGPAGAASIVAALAAAGYPQAAAVELASIQAFSVMRAFVCGLGSMRRRRRPPLP